MNTIQQNAGHVVLTTAQWIALSARPLDSHNYVELARDIDVISREEVQSLIKLANDNQRLHLFFGEGGAYLKPLARNKWAMQWILISRGVGWS